MNDPTASPALPVTDILVDGYTLSLDTVAEVGRADSRTRFAVPQNARMRMAASRELKREQEANHIPLYEFVSRLGDSRTSQIVDHQTRELQRSLLRFLDGGVGQAAPSDVVRSTLLIRANFLARGHTGVRPKVLQLLLDCLARDILPLIPRLGDSHKQVPVSYIGHMLIGEGEVLYRGERRKAGAALNGVGLKPIALESREALALVNGTSFMSGFAAITLSRAARLAFAADLCSALTSQVLSGNPAHFAAFLSEQKPRSVAHGGAERILWFMKGSQSFDAKPEQESVIPDGVSFPESHEPIQYRPPAGSTPHVTGVLTDALMWMSDWVTTEINSSNDDALFDAVTGLARHSGRVYGRRVGVAMDFLMTALASLGDLLCRQLELVMEERNRYWRTPSQVGRCGVDDCPSSSFHSFKSLQITASSLVAAALQNALPSVSCVAKPDEQDQVGEGTIAARDAYAVSGLIEQVTAIHLLSLCHAADLRGVEHLSPATRAAYDAVRNVSPFLDPGHPSPQDIEQVANLIESGHLQNIVTGLPQL